jgi:serine/threonine protein phosphatase PrpC
MTEHHALSDPGCVRASNQDRVLADGPLGLFVVADGMGGHSHGEMAAEIAISTIRYFLDSSRDRFDVTWPFGYSFDLSIDANRMVTAIQLANRQVWHHAEKGPEFSGMGTTVASILVNEDRGTVANVGDSRVYIYRSGELTLLSTDDTWIANVVRAGGQPVDAQNHPMRNVLMQAAGSQEHLEVHIKEIKLQSGDMVLLSSDGLHGVIGDAAIRSVLDSGGPVQDISARLVQCARAAGAPDNVSAVVLRYNP